MDDCIKRTVISKSCKIPIKAPSWQEALSLMRMSDDSETDLASNAADALITLTIHPLKESTLQWYTEAAVFEDDSSVDPRYSGNR